VITEVLVIAQQHFPRYSNSAKGIGFFVIFIAAILLFLLIATASQHRKYSSQTQQKLCRGCGASHPNFAAFCRRCGRRL
jgi:ribosomal protein L40E